MGCDIHVLLEIRRSEANWELCYGPFVCYACRGKKPGDECYACRGKGTTLEVWGARSYPMFGILAGVRSAMFPYIAGPRGIPPDATAETRKVYYDNGDMWLGDHSHSFVSLTELRAYDWEKLGIVDGVVGLSDWFAWDDESPIVEYSGGISGPGWKTIGPREAKKYVATHGAPVPPYRSIKRGIYSICDDPSKIAVRIQWTEKAEAFGADLLLALESFAVKEGIEKSDDVRIVFGFDS